jgi:hypothetical protein
VRHDVARTDSVLSVKNLIQTDYNADPANVKAVFLFGHVPVPYSGNFAADWHTPEHQGAWPADLFYGDMDGTWTDFSVNSKVAENPRNWNVPGDGKYDQSYPPSAVELQVGRVDLSNMTAFTKSESELLRQYLKKDHNYRHKLITVPRRGLIHDSTGTRDGEAFAASAWRNFAPWFGPVNITAVPIGQWFPALASQGYLAAYGSGGASYFSIAGLGNSGLYNEGTTWDFAATDTRAVFYLFCGSWLADWDSTDNIMRGVLGTQTFGLASVVAGQPHWFGHHMGLGETIGYSTRLTQNNKPNGLYRNHVDDSVGLVSVALMGDPTLRLQPVAPASGLTGAMGSSGANLNWAASPDGVLGYHVYRSAGPSGPFARVTSSLEPGTSFTDPSVTSGTYTYMVRAAKLEDTPSGTYFNPSQGIFVTVSGSLPSQPTVTITATATGASETGPDPGTFTFFRTGNTASALLVVYSITGNAINGTDYNQLPNSVTIPAGASSASIIVTPIDDTVAEGSETVSVTLAADSGYIVGSPGTAMITIADNDTTSREVVWFDDTLPGGAVPFSDGGDSWNWISSNPAPFSGSRAHQSSISSGLHEHYFNWAWDTLTLNPGDKLFAYVYLDPANVPGEVMLIWGGDNWEHRAYWGANYITYGQDGTVGRRYMGLLPPAGRWVRLEVPASAVGLEGRTVNGMAFTLYGGRAAWDYAGKTGQ